MSRDTLPQSNGDDPGTIAVSARKHNQQLEMRCRGGQQEADRSRLTCVSRDLLPGLVCDDVEEQRRDQRRQRPQSHRAVPAATRHGERAALMTRQTCSHVRDSPLGRGCGSDE